MSHSEEGENYWPGYVDALTSMVQVLAFVMMMLAMAVFMLSQNISKKAVEAIAQAVNADTKPNASVKELTQAIVDKLAQNTKAAAAAAPPPPAPTPPAAASKSAPAVSDASPAPEKLIGTRIGDNQAPKERNFQTPSNAPHLVVDFNDRSFTIDQQREQSLAAFVEKNKIVENAQAVVINAYAYSGDGALSEARRLAYYRAMTTRKQLVDAKVKPENIRVNVNDTADKDKGSTVDTIVAGGAAH
jgi:ribosomal protein L12E/L44/L45/RPP1/RPP2